jgi:hypothetical protein
MFSGKNLRRVISEMHYEQRLAIQLGVVAMILLPTIFISTIM